MTAPGHRLRTIAARLFSDRTMEWLIDPVLTDVQIEYRSAIAHGRVWRSRWIRLAGYVAFFKALGLYGYERAMRDWSEDASRTLARTVRLSAAAIVAVVLLILLPPGRSVPAYLMPYLIPQALPLAIPVGLTVGLFCGLGGRDISVRLTAAVLALALACSAGSLAAMAWAVPAASQAFRVSVAERLHRPNDAEVMQTKGLVEMTLAELRQRIDALTQAGRARQARVVRFAYHLRWGLPCAPFVLALFALAVMPRRPVRYWILAASACGVCFSYYLVLLAGTIAAREGTLPVAAGAWLPNLVFVVASTALLAAAAKRPGASAQA